MDMSSNNKILSIKEKLRDLGYLFSPISDNESINKIYELVINDIHFETKTSEEMFYLGVYLSFKKRI